MTRRRSQSPYVTRRRIELKAEVRKLARRRRIDTIGIGLMILATLIVLGIGIARGSLI